MNRWRDGARRVCEATGSYASAEPDPFYALILRVVAQRREIEERLRRTERLAAVSKLVGGIARELDNPIAAILLNHRAAWRNASRVRTPRTLLPFMR